MTHVPNSFAGRLGTINQPWVEAMDNPRPVYERSTREYVGDIIRRKVTKGVTCLKKNVQLVLDYHATDRVHLIVSAGANADGTPASVDFGYGWRFSGFSSQSISPSMMRMDFEYYRELPAVFSIGAFPGIAFVETSNSVKLQYFGQDLKVWTAFGPINNGLDFQVYVTKRTWGSGETATTHFDAAATMLFDDTRIESCISKQDDFTTDPISGDTIVAGDPKLFNRLRKEIYWESIDRNLFLKWWGKVWLNYYIAP